jgi:hypothetical protein
MAMERVYISTAGLSAPMYLGGSSSNILQRMPVAGAAVAAFVWDVAEPLVGSS